MATNVIVWWVSLCAVAALNVSAWFVSAVALNRRQNVLSAEAYRARRLQLLLSAVYVFGCAFRSAFPVFDVPRICLHNSWLSSVIVGRSVATLAELAYPATAVVLAYPTTQAFTPWKWFGLALLILSLYAIRLNNFVSTPVRPASSK